MRRGDRSLCIRLNRLQRVYRRYWSEIVSSVRRRIMSSRRWRCWLSSRGRRRVLIKLVSGGRFDQCWLGRGRWRWRRWQSYIRRIINIDGRRRRSLLLFRFVRSVTFRLVAAFFKFQPQRPIINTVRTSRLTKTDTTFANVF